MRGSILLLDRSCWSRLPPVRYANDFNYWLDSIDLWCDGFGIEIIGVRYLPEYSTDGEVRESFLALKFDV
jgi:hypothetical protein